MPQLVRSQDYHLTFRRNPGGENTVLFSLATLTRWQLQALPSPIPQSDLLSNFFNYPPSRRGNCLGSDLCQVIRSPGNQRGDPTACVFNTAFPPQPLRGRQPASCKPEQHASSLKPRPGKTGPQPLMKEAAAF